jgi:tRNA(Ile)-lysidine synthetase-like protein
MPKPPLSASNPLLEHLRELPEQILVGVSGGIDSVALLSALIEAGRRPIVIHFDHGWRKESAVDAAWVKDLAARYGLKFVLRKARKKSSPQREADARALRYAFFARTAARLKIRDLVLAHQADDQVETFLLQLFRGSGAGGLGMSARSDRDGLVIHRPWLAVWRDEIKSYAQRHKLTWRDDPSNHDLTHRRNLLRRRILPYLQKQWSPQLPRLLARAAEIARAENEWLESLISKIPPAAELSAAELKASPVARQRRLILRWLQFHGVSNIDFRDVEAVRGLAHSTLPARVNLSRGKFARRRAGRIFLS